MHSMNIKFGINIVKARKESGLEQKDLADLLNYTQPSVSRWENNKVDCPAYVLEDIARITNKKIEWFFQDHTGEPEKPVEKVTNLIQKSKGLLNGVSTNTEPSFYERMDSEYMKQMFEALLEESRRTNSLLLRVVEGQEEIKKNAEQNNRLIGELDKLQQQNEQYAKTLLLLEAGEISTAEALRLFKKTKSR